MSAQTASGKTFETMLTAAFRQQKYTFYEQARSKNSLGGREHRVDFTITHPVEAFISLKWQGTSGTVEEKVPFETIRLLHLLSQKPQILTPQNATKLKLSDVIMNADKAYIVLAGNGWNEKLTAWYIKNGLEHYVKYKPKIKILDFYDFMNLVNSNSI